MTIADHPLIVPDGYRIVTRFHLLPMRVAGHCRWCEWVRVIQRQQLEPNAEDGWPWEWEDVGYFDEVMPINKPVIDIGF